MKEFLKRKVEVKTMTEEQKRLEMALLKRIEFECSCADIEAQKTPELAAELRKLWEFVKDYGYVR